jgi:hypothetical protein
VPEPEQPPTDDGGWVANMSLDEQITATSNVMAVRDAINVFLVIIRDHREDGHDCPPYCVPSQLYNFLEAMDVSDFRMMLTVILKDMVDTYLTQQHQQRDI